MHFNLPFISTGGSDSENSGLTLADVNTAIDAKLENFDCSSEEAGLTLAEVNDAIDAKLEDFECTGGSGSSVDLTPVIGVDNVVQSLVEGETYLAGSVIPWEGKLLKLSENYEHTTPPRSISKEWGSQSVGDTPDLEGLFLTTDMENAIPTIGESLVLYDNYGSMESSVYLKIPIEPNEQKIIVVAPSSDGTMRIEYLCDTQDELANLMFMTQAMEAPEIVSGRSGSTAVFQCPASADNPVMIGFMAEPTATSGTSAVYIKSIIVEGEVQPPIGAYVDLLSLQSSIISNDIITASISKTVNECREDIDEVELMISNLNGYVFQITEDNEGLPQIRLIKDDISYLVSVTIEEEEVINHISFVVSGGTVQAPILPNVGNITRNNLYTIDWGDGSDLEDFSSSNAPIHTYAESETEYTVILKPQEGYTERGWLSNLWLAGNTKILRIVDFPTDSHCLCGDVTSVGDSFCANMFYECTSLTDLGNFKLPQDIIEVGDRFCNYMFYGCTSLAGLGNFQLPQGIIAVGYDFCRKMFSGCTSLADLGNLQLPQGITETFSRFCEGMFVDCTSLTDLGNLKLPQDIIAVGYGFCFKMFSGCTSLADLGNLQLPQGITNAEEGFCKEMFINCTSLTDLGSFTLPQNITNVGINFCSDMFKGCSALESVGSFNLPQSVEHASNNFCSRLFKDCTSLSDLGELQVPQSITSAGNHLCSQMFDCCTSLVDIGNFQLPQEITEVENNFCGSMFLGCTSLTNIGSLQIPQDVEIIGNIFCNNLFKGCTSLANIGDLSPLPDGVTGTDMYANMFVGTAVTAETNGFPASAWVEA